jgi:hypothetical protein
MRIVPHALIMNAVVAAFTFLVEVNCCLFWISLILGEEKKLPAENSEWDFYGRTICTNWRAGNWLLHCDSTSLHKSSLCIESETLTIPLTLFLA